MGVIPDLEGSPSSPAQSEFQRAVLVAHLLKHTLVRPATLNHWETASPLLFFIPKGVNSPLLSCRRPSLTAVLNFLRTLPSCNPSARPESTRPRTTPIALVV